jgi:hypothetical protein
MKFYNLNHNFHNEINDNYNNYENYDFQNECNASKSMSDWETKLHLVSPL